MTVQEKLRELIEAEMVDDGLLPDVKSVHTGEIELLRHDEYPAVFIIQQPGIYRDDGNKTMIEKNFVIVVNVIRPTVEESESLRDRIVLDLEGSPRGLMPFLRKARALLNIDSQKWGLTYSDINIGTGADGKGRQTAAAEVPVKMRTYMTIN